MNDSPSLDDLDPRLCAALKAAQALQATLQRTPSSADYAAYRSEKQPDLPAPTTVYRLMRSHQIGSWVEFVRLGGGADCEDRSRIPQRSLVDALQLVGKALSTDVLSSNAYDEYRERYPDLALPSSSVIRKRLGRWEEAVNQAGLQAPQRAAPRRPQPEQVLHALRTAASLTPGRLTPGRYSQLAAQANEEGGEWPDLMQILALFASFESALRDANIEIGDDLHPETLWTADEARRAIDNARTLLGRPLDEASYEQLRVRATRPMPSWQTVRQLLKRD